MFELASTTARPRIFATIKNQQMSAAVLLAVRQLEDRPVVKIFDTETEATNADLTNAVVFFDGVVSRHFRPIRTSNTRFLVPAWGRGAQWGVVVGRGCCKPDNHANCARYTTAVFFRAFEERVAQGDLPWGQRRQGHRRSRLPGGYQKFKRIYAA